MKLIRPSRHSSHMKWLGFGAVRLFEHRDHLAALDPGRLEPHALALGVDGEERADIGGTRARRMHGLVKPHVVGKQRAQAVPVALVEQRRRSGTTAADALRASGSGLGLRR